MPGCSKVIHENQMSLVVAGGQDSTGNRLKSVEIIAIDIENRSTPLTWTVLGAVYIYQDSWVLASLTGKSFSEASCIS